METSKNTIDLVKISEEEYVNFLCSGRFISLVNFINDNSSEDCGLLFKVGFVEGFNKCLKMIASNLESE